MSEFKDPGPTVTQERIERIVKSLEDTEDVQVEEIDVKSGSGKGDGFMSDIEDVRVTAVVRAVKRHYNWMIKSTPRNPDRYISSRLIYVLIYWFFNVFINIKWCVLKAPKYDYSYYLNKYGNILNTDLI